MIQGNRTRTAVFAILSIAASLLVPSIGSAEPGPHEITWAHATPSEVSRFVVYVSPVEGDFGQARQVDVGKPPGSRAGVLMSYSAIIVADEDEFVAIGAVGTDGVTGPPSQWAGLPPTKPGQPLLLP